MPLILLSITVVDSASTSDERSLQHNTYRVCSSILDKKDISPVVIVVVVVVVPPSLASGGGGVVTQSGVADTQPLPSFELTCTQPF